ncbi:MAG: four helix bundle protein [Desulfobacteraceae bacterium]|nr:MAG: four helix bundle protein [Desulfobacteraceae bacterium]
MKLTRFEEIEAWQQARKLVGLIYETIRSNGSFQKDFRLINQLQAAAVSAMSNIAEGFTRRSSKEFTQFLFISKSSAAEVQSQLYVALDQNYITPQQFEQVYNQAETVSKLTSGFIKYLNGRKTQQPNNPTNSTNSTNPTTPTAPNPLTPRHLYIS